MKYVLVNILLIFILCSCSHPKHPKLPEPPKQPELSFTEIRQCGCFKDIEQTAWLELPDNRRYSSTDTHMIIVSGAIGVVTNIRRDVSRSKFEKWKKRCQFDFIRDGNTQKFEWDYGFFSGDITYCMDAERLDIYAVKFDE